MRAGTELSRWARWKRWWRWWARRRRGGNDFGDMGTAFGLDAVTGQAPLGAPETDSAPVDRDRANRRSVW